MPNSAIRLLEELALRVNDLQKMEAFYTDVVGLELWGRPTGGSFLRVADGVDGHPQVLALFDRDTAVGQASTTLDHLAFVIDLADYEAEKERLIGLGVQVRTKEFPTFHWRSLFFADPDGNTVEFVCHDPSA